MFVSVLQSIPKGGLVLKNHQKMWYIIYGQSLNFSPLHFRGEEGVNFPSVWSKGEDIQRVRTGEYLYFQILYRLELL